jgi:hypothetical protein
MSILVSQAHAICPILTRHCRHVSALIEVVQPHIFVDHTDFKMIYLQAIAALISKHADTLAAASS